MAVTNDPQLTPGSKSSLCVDKHLFSNVLSHRILLMERRVAQDEIGTGFVNVCQAVTGRVIG
jgi:hypothetical protein